MGMNSSKPYTSRTIEYATFPDWVYPKDEQKPDVCTLASAVTLAGLDGKTFRMTAEDQRQLLGFPVFGKQAVTIDRERSKIHITRKVCFGTDFECITLEWPDVANYANNHRKIR